MAAVPIDDGYVITAITGPKGDSGDAAQYVEIAAPNGTAFKNGLPSTLTLTCECFGFTPAANAYQWYKKNGNIWELLTGQTTANLSVSSAGVYKVAVGGVYDIITMIAVDDGEASYSCSVSNENFSVATDTNLAPLETKIYDIEFTAYKGTTQLTAVASNPTMGQFAISVTGLTKQSDNKTLRYTTTAGTVIPANTVYEVTVYYEGTTITETKLITVSAARAGYGVVVDGIEVQFSQLPMPENGDLEVNDGISFSALKLSNDTNLYLETGNDSSETGKGWHYPYRSGDLYMRVWSDLEKGWGEAVRVVGEEGVGIADITQMYLATAMGSGVTTSSPGWSETPQVLTDTMRYLWTYEIITYTDTTQVSTTPIISRTRDVVTTEKAGGTTVIKADGTVVGTVDDGFSSVCSKNTLNFHSQSNGLANYEEQTFEVTIYKGSMSVNDLTANMVAVDVSANIEGNLSLVSKTVSNGTVTVTVNSTYNQTAPNGFIVVSILYGDEQYVSKVTVTSGARGVYLGIATGLNANGTVTYSDSSTRQAVLGDYVTWNGSTGTYAKGAQYAYVCTARNTHSWVVDNSAEACAAAFNDVMGIVDADDTVPAMLMAKKIAANTAFINSLFASQITMMQRNNKGGLIKSGNFAGTIDNNTGEVTGCTAGWAVDYYGNAFFNKVILKGRLEGFKNSIKVTANSCATLRTNIYSVLGEQWYKEGYIECTGFIEIQSKYRKIIMLVERFQNNGLGLFNFTGRSVFENDDGDSSLSYDDFDPHPTLANLPLYTTAILLQSSEDNSSSNYFFHYAIDSNISGSSTSGHLCCFNVLKAELYF